MIKIILCLASSVFLISGCVSRSQTPVKVAQKQFTLPRVPTVLQSSEERAVYLLAHYWDNFDFSDTSLIRNANITEQAFVDYIDLFPHVQMSMVEKSVANMLGRATAGDSIAFGHFMELYERYLYEPNSPFRQEDYYIAVLEAAIANSRVGELYKTRPRYQLEMSLKNRPNTIAADFSFTLRDGQSMKLSSVKAEYTLLFFNNPDCRDCARVKQLLTACSDLRVKIVAVYTDEDASLWRATEYPSGWLNGQAESATIKRLYDLRALPTLYLLDRDKRVVLKDAPVEYVLEYLAQ